MNLSSALLYGRKVLEEADITDAQIDAWALLEEVCGCDRTYYYMHMDEALTAEKENIYKEKIQLRAERIPLQHITGKAYFWGMEFLVNEHVLVPRFDTEVLVETVLKKLKGTEHILDMCTGSGCILLSLLREKEGCTGVGADISPEALSVAMKNANNHHIPAVFIQTDLFEHITEKYDIIVSNPPYIPTKVIETLEAEVKLHDPMLALDGMEDGLYFYRKIIGQADQFLNEGGSLCFEIGHDQGSAVSELMREAGYEDVVVIKDLSGLDRVVTGGKPCLTN